MAQLTWNLEQLKKSLSQNKDIKSWVITKENIQRRERYFMLDGATMITDQDRDVHVQNIWVKIIVRLPKADRQGEIVKKFFTALPLQSQIDAAIDAAQQTDHQAWSMPDGAPAGLPQLRTADPKIAEDINRVMDEVTSRMNTCVSKKRPTRFNSAELFLSIHDRELHLSNGLTHRSSQSRVYAEAAYSISKVDSRGEVQSDEYLNTRWAVNLDDLSLEGLFDETTDRVERSLDVEKPVTGKYPVIVDAEVLANLFNGHVSHLSAMHSYLGLPFKKPGSPLIPHARGDLITLTLDPSLEFGADTVAVSEQGVAQAPLRLVDRNQVVATATDKQHGDYLKMSPTTTRGNIVVEAGTLSYKQLTEFAPQVIEILQFSALFVEANSGTFSSEIRLARVYDNVRGTVRYLKGGSVSGSIHENFSNARFSSHRVKHSVFSSNDMRGQGYYGPAYALLNDVSVVG